MHRTYRRPRKSVVQLTSLLDLLFVMIFVSLIQDKKVEQTTPAKKVVEKKVEKKEIKKEPGPPTVVVPQNFALTGVFKFYATSSNPSVPTGSFRVKGNLNRKSGKVSLGGVSWIERPSRYDMVPMNGVFDSETGAFRGRIDFQGCQAFTLQRLRRGDKNPLSGEWSGEYRCSQGSTGLTLTIN